MSEFFESQEPKTVPCCHDRPPKYDSCQPSQDILTSVIENEHTRRILLQRLYKVGTDFLKLGEKKPTEGDNLVFAELLLEMGGLYKKGMQMSTELANVYKERAVQNPELCTAMSRLTDSEFNRTYASLRRDSNRQMRYEMAQNHKDCGDCYDRDCAYNHRRSLGTKKIEGAGDSPCDSPCSYDRFLKLSVKVDEIDDKLGQSLQSHDTANMLKTTHDTPHKTTRKLLEKKFEAFSSALMVPRVIIL